MILGPDGEKMSKSRGNVISPDDVVEEHGADAMRLYSMFMGPLSATKPWQMEQVAGVSRFMQRCAALPALATSPTAAGAQAEALGKETQQLMHQTIKKVGQDIEQLSFNTAISQLMVYSRHLNSLGTAEGGEKVEGSVPRESVAVLARLLQPFAPHLAEEMWEELQQQQQQHDDVEAR
jgi:leucyl-tRNA synthetase